MKNKNSIEYLLAVLRAGLWADAGFTDFHNHRIKETVDWNEVYQLAEEQSIVGVVLAGIDHFNIKPPQELLFQWIGVVQMLEQQNKAMNKFIARLIEKIRGADIYTLLVKGQGVAQCYEHPLWRSCGDIDLYLNKSNYINAKQFLAPIASDVDEENKKMLHLGMCIGNWSVELHGTMHTELSRRINNGLDDIHRKIFYEGEVRSWRNNGVPVFLPSANNDALIVFTHFIQHFFIEGVGLRQICDWCRLLWSYRKEINLKVLEQRIRKMGLMSEWKVFASLAVDYLGMPKEAMPFYDSATSLNRKANRVLDRIIMSGNLGHNNDVSYRVKYTGVKYNMVSLWRRLKDFAGLTLIFPIDAPKFFVHYVYSKI